MRRRADELVPLRAGAKAPLRLEVRRPVSACAALHRAAHWDRAPWVTAAAPTAHPQRSPRRHAYERRERRARNLALGLGRVRAVVARLVAKRRQVPRVRWRRRGRRGEAGWPRRRGRRRGRRGRRRGRVWRRVPAVAEPIVFRIPCATIRASVGADEIFVCVPCVNEWRIVAVGGGRHGRACNVDMLAAWAVGQVGESGHADVVAYRARFDRVATEATAGSDVAHRFAVAPPVTTPEPAAVHLRRRRRRRRGWR